MDTDTLRALREPAGRALLTELAGYDPADELRLATRLRRDHPAELVGAALTQARLRQRGAAKFGPDAARMWFTPAGLEQSTSREDAAHRARRYAEADVGLVADLCCGIGGDLVAMARTGLDVVGMDLDPLTAEVARANIEETAETGVWAEVQLGDVTAADLTGFSAAFCDPARRSARGRTFDPKAYSPPWDFLLALAERVPATGVKVAPGIDHALVPATAEAEWVSWAGGLKEAALWFGPLASAGASRRATLLPSGHTLTEVDLEPAGVGPVRRYLYEPDPAVIRAGLVGHVATEVDGVLLDPAIAYVTSDRRVETAFATRFEINEVLPFQLKRVRALLRDRGIGRLEIKKRGFAVEPEQLRRQLRLTGEFGRAAGVLFLTRIGTDPVALLGRRDGAEVER